MLGKQLFERALGIEEPWYIDKINFDEEEKRLDIHIDFERGAKFNYTDEEEGIDGEFKAYDTKEKTWRSSWKNWPKNTPSTARWKTRGLWKRRTNSPSKR